MTTSAPPSDIDASLRTVDESRPGLGRRFWALCGATGLSGLGDGMVLVAFPLLAARLTNDPRWVSGVVVAATLPNLAAMHIGAMVDRWDRRRLAVAGELLRGLLVTLFAAVIAVGVAVPLALLYGVVFILGLGRTSTETVAQASLPDIVDERSLGRANGALASTEAALSEMAGQSLGGVFFALAVSAPFFIDGMTFVGSAVLLALALPRSAARAVTGRAAGGVREGWAYFRAQRVLVLLAGTIVAFAFCQAMVLGPLVLFVTDDLGLTETGFGLLMAGTAVGSVVGGVLAGRFDRRWGPAALLTVAGVMISAAYFVAGFWAITWVVAVGLFGEAVWVAIGNVVSVTLRQRIIPASHLGRVAGIFRFLIVGAFPLGALAGGILAHAVELRTPLLMAAGLQLMAVALVGPRLAHVLRADAMRAS